MIGMGRVTKLSKPGRIIGTYLCKSGLIRKKYRWKSFCLCLKRILKYRDCESVCVQILASTSKNLALYLFISFYSCRYLKNLLMLIEYKNIIANSCKEPTRQQPSKRDESGLRKVSAKFVQMQKVGCSNCLEGSCQEADQKSDNRLLCAGFKQSKSSSRN